MELYQHLALAKNLRGIVYFNPKLDVENEVGWLKRKFRYRDLGVGKSLADKSGCQKFRVIDMGWDERKLEVEAVKLASAFVSPLFVLKAESLKDFEKQGVLLAEIKIKEKLNDVELKRNLRLVNYSITDFYEESIELAKKRDFEGRKLLVEKDMRRFWRLKPESSGRTLIFYLEPMKLIDGDSIFLSLIPGIVIQKWSV
jgi:hypothetical protein